MRRAPTATPTPPTQCGNTLAVVRPLKALTTLLTLRAETMRIPRQLLLGAIGEQSHHHAFHVASDTASLLRRSAVMLAHPEAASDAAREVHPWLRVPRVELRARDAELPQLDHGLVELAAQPGHGRDQRYGNAPFGWTHVSNLDAIE